jgi:flagellin
LAEIKRIAVSSEFNDQLVGTGETYEVQVGTEDSENDRISLKMGDAQAVHTGLNVISLKDSTSARLSISRIDTVMDRLNTERARVGSLHNRINNAIANNESKHDSLMSAASRIQDADMAFETSQMTATQIKLQAGAAAMSQAKQLPATSYQLVSSN